MMAGKEENRIFVGGLSWDVTERQLEHAFGRYGKVIECQVPVVEFFFSGEFIVYLSNCYCNCTDYERAKRTNMDERAC